MHAARELRAALRISDSSQNAMTFVGRLDAGC
jgi:hypothetical protein